MVGGHEKARGEVLESIAIGKAFLKAQRMFTVMEGKTAFHFECTQMDYGRLWKDLVKVWTGANAMSVASLLMMAAWVSGGFR